MNLILLVAFQSCAASPSLCDAPEHQEVEDLKRLIELFKPAPINEAQFEVACKSAIGKLNVLRLRYPTALRSGVPENDMVHSTVFIPKHSMGKRFPSVIILHAFGSQGMVNELHLAKALALNGIVAAAMELPYHMHRAPKGMRSGEFFSRTTMQNAMQAIRQAVMDAERLIDWLCMQPFVDAEKLCAIGISFGGILGTLLAGVDERVKVCVNVLGGDLAITIWESWLTRQFRRLLERQGFTLNAIRSITHWVNPTTYAPLAREKRILMVMSEYDLFVPRRACVELWRALGCPPIIRLYTGHLCAQFSAPYLKSAVISFTKMTLLEDMGAHEAASKLGHVPSIAVKSEFILPIGGNGGVGFAIELGDIDRARRTSIDFHLTSGGLYAGFQWEVSRHLAIGLCMRLDEKRIIRPHISAFIIF